MVPAAGCAFQRPYRLNALLRDASRGRPRGVDGWENEFPGVFGGFSVYGNDLAQLALGLGHGGGLVGGEDGLMVDMIFELSDSVFLTDEFPGICCGFFIGSTGRTQLALGLGRDIGLAGGKSDFKVSVMVGTPSSVFLVGELVGVFGGSAVGSIGPYAAHARPRPRHRPGERRGRPQGERGGRDSQQRLPGWRVPGHLLRLLFRSSGLTQLTLSLDRDNGLVSGEGGLNVRMMAEAPGNIFLVGEFLVIFGGFSVGRRASRSSCSASAATSA